MTDGFYGSGTKPPAELVKGRDLVRVPGGAYELVSDLRESPSGWWRIVTRSGVRHVPYCFPVAWMGQGAAEELRDKAMERLR